MWYRIIASLLVVAVCGIMFIAFKDSSSGPAEEDQANTPAISIPSAPASGGGKNFNF